MASAGLAVCLRPSTLQVVHAIPGLVGTGCLAAISMTAMPAQDQLGSLVFRLQVTAIRRTADADVRVVGINFEHLLVIERLELTV